VCLKLFGPKGEEVAEEWRKLQEVKHFLVFTKYTFDDHIADSVVGGNIGLEKRI
jgi:hypothetical protein